MKTIEEIFKELGGVPRKIVPNNPKCFATDASLYEPILNVAMERLASYYNIIFELLPPRRPELLRRKARFNDSISLGDFEVQPQQGVNKTLIKKLGTLGFIDQGENIIFIGRTGAGKSYLAQALEQRSCLNGFESLYFPFNRQFKQVQEAEAAGTYLKLLERIKRKNE